MRTLPRYILALALGVLPVGVVVAGPPQTGTLHVAVVDEQGAPILAALVQLIGSTRSVLREGRTDASGHIALEAVPYGRYELQVSDPIYTDTLQVIELDEASLDLSVVLRPFGIEDEVTVTASRGAVQEISEVPATVRTLNQVELRARAVDLLPRMLDEEPGILTQQTTPGQGSPILRGQSAQAILYLLDGIRYNNAAYRAGNTQYLGWIPDVAVESVEVLLGPAGVNYGSDALGGAINVLSTRVPGFRVGRSPWTGNLRVYGEAASLGAGVNATGGYADDKLSGYLALSGARHQDVRGGGTDDSHHSTVRFLGFSQDQMRANFGNRYVDTAYSQTGLSTKANFRLGTASNLSAYFTGSSQFDIRRYDRMLGGDGRVIAGFDPQRLRFGYLRYDRFFADTVFDATFSFNQQTDGRVNQRRLTNPVETEENTVTALGFEASGSRDFRPHLLTIGAEIYDELTDTARFETQGGVTEQVRPRYPTDARYTSFGVFLLDDFRAFNERLNMSVGLRYSAFRYAAKAIDNIINGEATIPDTKETFNDLTMNLGGTYAITDEVGVWGRVARGFRAPSIFDLGEIGLTGGGFEVTSEDAVSFDSLIGNSASRNAVSTGIRWASLQPERLWSFEAGFRWFADDIRFEVTAFDSEFDDAISRRVIIIDRPVVGDTIGGEEIIAQDEEGRIFVALEPDPVVSRANIGSVRVRGLELLAQKTFGTTWMATLKASLQRGWELDTGFFARKIAPDNLTAIARWRSRGGSFWLEGVVKAAATQDRLNPGDIEDTRIGAFRDADDIADFFVSQGPRLGLVEDGILLATGETLDQVIERVLGPDGAGAPLFTATPGWITLGIRGSWGITANQNLSFAITNITDANYRLHGSGFDALGISANLSYSIGF